MLLTEIAIKKLLLETIQLLIGMTDPGNFCFIFNGVNLLCTATREFFCCPLILRALWCADASTTYFLVFVYIAGNGSGRN
jgi:hypothetical protein